MSHNFVGDHPYVAALFRDFVLKQAALLRLELVNCGLGTYTESGWTDDNVASAIWRGISDVVLKCKASMEDGLQATQWKEPYKDILLGENVKLCDQALLNLGKEIEKVWAPAAKSIVRHHSNTDHTFVHVENLELRDCSITSRGAGGLASHLMKICVEGGMFGEEGLVRRLGLERNCIQDDGAGALDELVKGVGCEVMLDGNMVSDELVTSFGAACGSTYYDMSVCLFPDDVWNNGRSGIYAGKGGAFKLPELDWKIDNFRGKTADAVEKHVRKVRDTMKAERANAEEERRLIEEAMREAADTGSEPETSPTSKKQKEEEEAAAKAAAEAETLKKKRKKKTEDEKAKLMLRTSRTIFEVQEGMEKAQKLASTKWWQANSPGPKGKGKAGSSPSKLSPIKGKTAGSPGSGKGLPLMTDYAVLPEWATLTPAHYRELNPRAYARAKEQMAATM
jgi:hypothetical protein